MRFQENLHHKITVWCCLTVREGRFYLILLHMKIDGNSFLHDLQRPTSLLIHMVWWALFTHQDRASLLSAAEDLEPLSLESCLCGFQGFPCCNSNRSNFQRRFYTDGSGRGDKAAASTTPLPLSVVMRWGAGWVGLELELHNGCLSELIKKKKKRCFIPCVGVNMGRNGDGCLQCFLFTGHKDR